jgi:hypothetical protein
MLDLPVLFAWLLPLAAAAAGGGSGSGSGSGSPAPTRKAAVDADFELAVGEEARIEALGLRVRFESVTNDSRCPIDVVCVWEGDATLVLELEQGGAPKQQHEAHTSRRGGGPLTFAGHELRVIGLVPQPHSKKPIAPSAYRATLRVVRSSAAAPVPESLQY